MAKFNNEQVSKVDKIHRHCMDELQESRDNSVRNRNYVNNNQYTADEKAYLEKQKRLALVYNQLRPRLQNLKGTEQQNRVGIVFRPQYSKYSQIADLYQKLWFTMVNQNKFEDELSKTFEDGLVYDIGGFIECNIIQNKRGYKEHKFTACNPFSIFVDPESRQYDLSDARYIIKETWMRLDEIKAIYGEFTSEAPEDPSLWKKWWNDLANTISNIMGATNYQESYYDENGDRYKVVELQERVIVSEYKLYDTQSDRYFKKEEKDLTKEDKENYQIINKSPKTKIKYTTVLPAKDALLYEGFNGMEDCDMFNVFRFGSWDSNIKKSEDTSFISLLIDLQRDYNRTRSTYNYALLMTQMSKTFVSDLDTELKEDLEMNGGNPGYVGVFRDGKNQPYQLKNGIIDPNVYNMMQDIISQMDQISSLGDTRFGRSEGSRESGKLFAMKEEVSMVTINPYFKNLSKTRLQCAEYFMKTLKYVYNDQDRVVNLMDRTGNKIEEAIINMPFEGDILNNVTDFEGYVVPDEGKFSTTALQHEFEKLFAIVNLMGGQPELIHWRSVLEKSGLSDIEPFIQHIESVLGQNQQIAEQQRALEENQAISNMVQSEQDALQTEA